MTSFVGSDGSDYMLGVLFGQVEPPLASYWLGLLNEFPESGDSGDTIIEPSFDPVYARIEVPNTITWWGLNEAGEVENLVDLIWPPPSGNYDWGQLVAVAVLDVPDIGQGRLLLSGMLSPPITLEPASGNAAQIDAGGVSFSLASVDPNYEPS